MRKSGSQPEEDYTEYLSNETPSRHECDICDECVWRFFCSLQLSTIVDVSGVLRDPRLRKAIVKFYQSGIQYYPLDANV